MPDHRADPGLPSGHIPAAQPAEEDPDGMIRTERELRRLDDELRQLRREGRKDARLIWATLITVAIGLLCLAAVGLRGH